VKGQNCGLRIADCGLDICSVKMKKAASFLAANLQSEVCNRQF